MTRPKEKSEQILEHFKEGCRQVAAKAIWTWLLHTYGAKMRDKPWRRPADCVADLNVAPSTVSRGLNEGMLSLQSLVYILGVINRSFADLPFPGRVPVAIGGFRQAVSWLSPGDKMLPFVDPTLEESCWLASVSENRHEWTVLWATAQAGADADAWPQLESLHSRIRKRAESLFEWFRRERIQEEEEDRPLQTVGPKVLNELWTRWGMIWADVSIELYGGNSHGWLEDRS